MTTLELLLAATLGVPGTPAMLAAPATDPPTADGPDLAEAERLFNEGLTRYETADYEGAIETFTLALSEVRGQGVNDFHVLGPLLFNIGRARMHAYEIDHEAEHLRQAAAIFSRFIEGAEAAPTEADEADVAEARTQIEQIQVQLEQLAAEPDTSAEPAPGPPTPAGGEPAAGPRDVDSERQAARARRVGAGLTASGVALLGGGVGMLVWGLGYGPAAESQVAELDQLGLPAEHPVFSEGADFIAAERRKGTTWVVAGGVAATLGLTGLVVGISQLVKAKRLTHSKHAVAAAAMLSPEGVVVGVHGRF